MEKMKSLQELWEEVKREEKFSTYQTEDDSDNDGGCEKDWVD